MNKRIYIVSGLDNTGKDTIIGILEKLLYNKQYNKSTQYSVLNVHALKPLYNTDIDLENDIDLQDYFQQYYKTLQSYITAILKNDIDVLVFNRFYTEEYIYGQLYRCRTEDNCRHLIDFTIKCIIDCLIDNYIYSGVGTYEEAYKWIKENIVYIKTVCPSEFLIQQDDGLSQSKNNIDYINKEQELFNNYIDILKESGFTTIKIKTTKADQNNGIVWTDKEAELKEAISLLI